MSLGRIIVVAGLVFGSEAARQGLLTQVHTTGILGMQSAVKLLLGASGVFSELRDSLNKIWDLNRALGRQYSAWRFRSSFWVLAGGVPGLLWQFRR
jgi:uncharacterized BrkB/YihY/UPF0761 family membrane protein